MIAFGTYSSESPHWWNTPHAPNPTYSHSHMHAWTHGCTHTCLHTHTHTHTHAHARTHTHTHEKCPLNTSECLCLNQNPISKPDLAFLLLPLWVATITTLIISLLLCIICVSMPLTARPSLIKKGTWDFSMHSGLCACCAAHNVGTGTDESTQVLAMLEEL